VLGLAAHAVARCVKFAQQTEVLHLVHHLQQRGSVHGLPGLAQRQSLMHGLA
jgi:hypothetical protein